MSIDLFVLQKEIADIAAKAGEKIMLYFHDEQNWEKENGQFISHKKDQTPVTLADQAADQFIVAALKKITPQIQILSEEGGQKLSQFHLAWLVDPLDGTRQFIRRSGYFTVNIGLVRDGVPILGVVYEPVRKKMYVGYLGQNDKACVTPPDNVLRICHGSFTQRLDLFENLMNACRDRGISMQTELISSSFKYCLVADHTFDIAISMHKMCGWDIAAAHAVVTASGGVVGIWDPVTHAITPIDYLDGLMTGADVPPGVTALSARAIQMLGITASINRTS